MNAANELLHALRHDRQFIMHHRLRFCTFVIALSCGALVLAQPTPAPATTTAQTTSQTGRVSYYGRSFTGRQTASGELFDPNAMTMAHRTLPFGTVVRITNLRNKRSALLRVNDRGPFVQQRVADVSLAAAKQLRMVRVGVIRAKVEVIDSGIESRRQNQNTETR